MSQQQTFEGVVAKRTLTVTEITMLRQLVALCDHTDHLHTRLSWTMVQKRSGAFTNDFLYYRNGLLVGYLALYEWGDEEKELIGLVHPAYRHQGIFSELFKAAVKEGQQRHVQRFILVCERSSQSGLEFARSIGAYLDFSEHEMHLHDFQESQRFDERLYFRKADMGDLEALAKVQSESFGDDMERSRQKIIRCLQDPDRPYYLMTFGEEEVGCEEPVGCLRLDYGDDVIGIYAFGILPAYRGRGYGRQMLEEAVRTIHARNSLPIMLDVDVNNTTAIKLYQSCGFRIKMTYDYYASDLQPDK